jgi:TonB family protein
MFDLIQTGSGTWWPKSPYASVAAHCLLLAWLFQAPKPIFVSPSYLQRGVEGGSVTQLYWPAHPRVDSASAMAVQTHLTWQRAHSLSRASKPKSNPSETHSTEPTASNTQGAPMPAGSRNGSVSQGAFFGPDVRPALWASGADPVLTSTDLAGIPEGNVVVEVTIDQDGNVTQTVLLHGVKPDVDSKVIAALVAWHFHPATRFGVPIPSKQDIYYHFPRQ